MPANALENARGAVEASADAEDADAADAKGTASKPSGGLKQWLPLIITLVTMPALAFAMTQFVLIPKLKKSLSNVGEPAVAAAASAGAPESGSGEAASKTRAMVPLSKLLVNVAGTMGTRYLMTSVTLVGNCADFKSRIEDHKDQLLDLASGTLSSKTISDLEKPGARNVIRAELMTVFNNALGGPYVQEIYITELAIQ